MSKPECKREHLKPEMLDGSVAERFWRFVAKRGATECWLWQGAKLAKYGQFKWRDKPHGAHRISVLLDGRDQPAGMVVMHSCDQPLCVNPKHLKVATASENMMDAVHKERHSRGVLNGMAKMDEAKVRELRALYATGNYKQKDLAKRFGIASSMVSFIVTRRHWSHVT
jgi:hypothetical protein